MTFGDFIKNRRVALGLTLRQFCQKSELDPGNYSKLERGVLTPPQERELLEKYAKCLQLKDGSSEWFEFFDLAATGTGRIPDDVMQHKEAITHLPLIFRTIRGERLSKEELERLKKKVLGE